MRPAAPRATLSQDGRLVAYVYGTRLLLIDATTGQSRSEQLPHQASQLAFSPDARLITAANHETLSLFQVDDGLTLLGQARLPAKPYRLITSADGTSLASFVYNDEESVVGVWQGTNLVPLLGASGHSLGGILPDSVWLNVPHSRFLIWGQQGPGAFGGTGTPYIRLFDYGSGPLREVWDGGSLGFDPNGFVMPLTATTFAAYDRSQMRIYDTEAPEKAVSTYRFDDMEKLVCSPDGTRMAWLWNTGRTGSITYHLASLRPGVDASPTVLSFDHMGAFEKFAIADSGAITLVYGKEPKFLHIFQSSGGQLVSTGQIDVKG